MTALQHTIYRAATDAEFRRRLQTGALEAWGEAPTAEEREALLALRYLLALSPQSLAALTETEPSPLGWDLTANALPDARAQTT